MKGIYETLWRNKYLTVEALSFDDMIERLESAVNELKAMRADGVKLDVRGVGDDYARLYTEDGSVAEKHGLVEEWDDDELE